VIAKLQPCSNALPPARPDMRARRSFVSDGATERLEKSSSSRGDFLGACRVRPVGPHTGWEHVAAATRSLPRRPALEAPGDSLRVPAAPGTGAEDGAGWALRRLDETTLELRTCKEAQGGMRYLMPLDGSHLRHVDGGARGDLAHFSLLAPPVVRRPAVHPCLLAKPQQCGD
jgi:hypothetical protein